MDTGGVSQKQNDFIVFEIWASLLLAAVVISVLVAADMQLFA